MELLKRRDRNSDGIARASCVLVCYVPAGGAGSLDLMATGASQLRCAEGAEKGGCDMQNRAFGKAILVALACLILFPLAAAAQSSIAGLVRDESGWCCRA